LGSELGELIHERDENVFDVNIHVKVAGGV